MKPNIKHRKYHIPSPPDTVTSSLPTIHFIVIQSSPSGPHQWLTLRNIWAYLAIRATIQPITML